jgi:hypothetical protein
VIVQHMAKSVEHYGPPELGACAHYILGDVDLDPASCATANTLIHAKRFYTKEENGLALPWYGRVYLNPPGGRVEVEGKEYNSAAYWWSRLAAQWMAGAVDSALFVVFNLEILRYAQEFPTPHPLRFPHLFPLNRLDFYKPNPANPGEAIPQGQPGHPNAVVLLPGNVAQVGRFFHVFERWGLCFPGHATPER